MLGFFGDFSGRYIVEETRKKSIEAYPVWVEDTTRINIFLNDGKQEYKFVNEGACVPEEKQAYMLELMEGLSDMETLVISGSLSKGMENRFYDQVMKLCQRKGASSHKRRNKQCRVGKDNETAVRLTNRTGLTSTVVLFLDIIHCLVFI